MKPFDLEAALRGEKVVTSNGDDAIITEVVYGDFDVGDNTELESLEGIPKKVTGDFYCFRCKVKFNRKQIEAVCDVGGTIYY
jgi:hypothetical protein